MRTRARGKEQKRKEYKKKSHVKYIFYRGGYGRNLPKALWE